MTPIAVTDHPSFILPPSQFFSDVTKVVYELKEKLKDVMMSSTGMLEYFLYDKISLHSVLAGHNNTLRQGDVVGKE